MPIATDENATITVNGIEVASGEWSQEIWMDTGVTVIEIVVALGDKSGTNIIFVENAPVENRATLEYIDISAGWFEQVFDSEITEYFVVVPYSTAFIKVAPYATDKNAAIYVNGVPLENGEESQEIMLTDGEGKTEIEIVVISGSETMTYRIYVGRRKLATLDFIFLSRGWLESDFAPGIHEYSAVVPSGISSITITPTDTDKNAIIYVFVNDREVFVGPPSGEIELEIGEENAIIEIIVTEEGKSDIIYYIFVGRQDNLIV